MKSRVYQYFWPEKSLYLKWSPISFEPLTFLIPKKFGPWEIWTQRSLVPKNFGFREIWSSHEYHHMEISCRARTSRGTNFLGPKKVRAQNKIGDHFSYSPKNIFEHIINHSEDCEAEMQWWYSQCINLFSSSLKVLKRDEKTKNVNKHTKNVNIQKRTCCSNLFVMQILLPSLPKKNQQRSSCQSIKTKQTIPKQLLNGPKK